MNAPQIVDKFYESCHPCTEIIQADLDDLAVLVQTAFDMGALLQRAIIADEQQDQGFLLAPNPIFAITYPEAPTQTPSASGEKQ